MRQEIRVHTDAGVADRETQGGLIVITRDLFYGEENTSGSFREFDRVAENINDDLLELGVISEIPVVVDLITPKGLPLAAKTLVILLKLHCYRLALLGTKLRMRVNPDNYR